MGAAIDARPSRRPCATFLSWRALALSLLALFPLVQAVAQNTVVNIPPLTRPVTDLTVTLSVEQASRLEARLREFEIRKGSQIAVLIVPTTQPETIDQFAIRVAEQWKVGRTKIDDGAILLVAKDDRTVRIEVGYGLEGALNDATSKRIIDETVVPRFRQGDVAGGIEAGVDRMMRVIEGERLPAPRAQPGTTARDASAWPLLLLAALVAGGFLRALLGRVVGAMLTGGLIGGVAWLLAGTAVVAVLAGVAGFLFTLIGGGRSALPGTYLGGGPGMPGRGGWGGGSRGGGGWGSGGWGSGGLGGGGGGWSGGGGSFGGGGASGRW